MLNLALINSNYLMPIENFAKNHFTAIEKQQLNDAIATILDIVGAKTYNLTPKERSKYGKVGNQKKLLINKVKEFHDRTPDFSSPDVDWSEFEADYATRSYVESRHAQLQSAMLMLLNIKIMHDYDNHMDALRDYQHALYKNRFGNQYGYAAKIDELKVFFPKTGKKKKADK